MIGNNNKSTTEISDSIVVEQGTTEPKDKME